MALFASDIISLACQIANAPGFTAQGLKILNSALADLSDVADLDLCRNIYSGITLTIDNGSGSGSGPYNLPLDYKRAERDGVRYRYLGETYTLISVDLAEFFQMPQQSGLASFPEFYATDTSPLGAEPPTAPLLYVWPPSNIAVTLYVQYRRLLPDIALANITTTVPWFPNQEYLRYKVAAGLMEITGDSRLGAFTALADEKLRTFMKLTNDDEGRAKTVTLDRRRFGPGYATLPNTKTLGW